MRRHLGIDVIEGTGASYSFVATGESLLLWLKEAVENENAKGAAAPAGDGTKADRPYVINTAEQWKRARVTFALPAYRTKNCFLKVAGRVIQKHANKASGGHADGFYMSDVKFSGKVGAETGTVWARTDGASYREFAKHMLVHMKGSDSHDFEADAGVAWSKAKMDKLRKVLTDGGYDLSGKAEDTIGAALPLLAAVMFISEPARNPRAFPVGLMVLDLMGQPYSTSTGGKFYTWDRVLAHPERVDPGFKGSAPLAKPQKGPDPNDKSKIIEYTQKKQLVKVEGKLPASPSGSASSSSAIDVATDYIQMKEAAILSRWLVEKLKKSAARVGGGTYIFSAVGAAEDLTGRMLLNNLDKEQMKRAVGASGVPRAKVVRAAMEKEVRDLITRRCQSMD